MKALKVIIGAILGLGAIAAIVETVSEKSGAGLLAAFIGFRWILAGWSIYSGLKSTKKGIKTNLNNKL
jgi:hypothetical protein